MINLRRATGIIFKTRLLNVPPMCPNEIRVMPKLQRQYLSCFHLILILKFLLKEFGRKNEVILFCVSRITKTVSALDYIIANT